MILFSSDQAKLAELPAPLRESFIQNQEPTYLQLISCEGKMHLGKWLELPVELSSLEEMQAHIESLFKRLFPDYSSKEQPFLVFALPKHGYEPL